MASVSWLSNKLRNGGIYISQGYTVPADVSRVDATLVCATWPTADPGIVLSWRADASFDGGNTWQQIGGGAWRAGQGVLPKGPPSMSLGLVPYRGALVRVYVELTGSIRFALDGQVT